MVFQLLIQADVICKLCMILSELFYCEVNNLHIPHDKKDLDKNRKQFAAGLCLDTKLKDQNRALHSPFFTILHYESTKWKTYGF